MTRTEPLAIIVGGPCGTGKTTVGELLAKALNADFIEGDTLHPPANIEKMSHGVPLTDDDRWDWLKEVATQVSGAASANTNQVAVASCSALTKSYRQWLRKHCNTRLMIIFLWDTEERIFERVTSREGHYMGSEMVRSQVGLMQVPTEEEQDSFSYKTTKPAEELVKDILAEIEIK